MRFAIVDSFPDINNAETECILRISKAAKSLGYECIVIDTEGYILSTKKNIREELKPIDFVLINHFISPHLLDCFSYTVMWNPVKFLVDWGYEMTSTHILSCDDFLVYDSEILQNHTKSILRPLSRYCNDFISMVPSCFGELLPPLVNKNTEDKKISMFYCGINWERLGNKKGRHHDLFKLLDSLKYMNFYGPIKIANERPWKGFKCFRGDIPFDGYSVVQKVNEAGVALILSSDSHRESHAPTNRLYEACAAGAVIISDDNPFVKKYFKDCVLYVEYDKDYKKMGKIINEHFQWICNNKEKANELAKKSQSIYKELFTLEGQLKVIAHQHEDRKKKVQEQIYGKTYYRIALIISINTMKDTAKLSLASANKVQIANHQVKCYISCPKSLIKDLDIYLKKISFKLNTEIWEKSDSTYLGSQILNMNLEQMDFQLMAFLNEGEELYSHHFLHNAGLFTHNPESLAILSSSCIIDSNKIAPDRNKEKNISKTSKNKYAYYTLFPESQISSLLNLEHAVPACSIMVNRSIFNDLKRWPIDCANSRLFSFFALKAYGHQKLTFNQRVLSSFRKDCLILDEKKIQFEILCLLEYFKLNLNIICEKATMAKYNYLQYYIVNNLKLDKKIGNYLRTNHRFIYKITVWILNLFK